MFVADPTLDIVLRGLILTALAMIWIVILVRVNGLRSFSKMTNFDFVMTVATGSLLAGAGQSTDWAGFGQAAAAMAALFIVQFTAAKLRKVSDTVESVMQNEPVLLMRNGEFERTAMQRERVAESDLVAKLREANAIDMSKIHAVVLETTGDVSVLHGDDKMDARLIENVRREKGG